MPPLNIKEIEQEYKKAEEEMKETGDRGTTVEVARHIPALLLALSQAREEALEEVIGAVGKMDILNVEPKILPRGSKERELIIWARNIILSAIRSLKKRE